VCYICESPVASDGGDAQQGAHVPDPTTTELELGGRPAECARNLVTNAATLPQLVAEFWGGGICQTPPIIEPGARTEVLDALKARRIRMTDEEAQAVGKGR
jgi:hypothetical protein